MSNELKVEDFVEGMEVMADTRLQSDPIFGTLAECFNGDWALCNDTIGASIAQTAPYLKINTHGRLYSIFLSTSKRFTGYVQGVSEKPEVVQAATERN